MKTSCCDVDFFCFKVISLRYNMKWINPLCLAWQQYIYILKFFFFFTDLDY